MIISDNSFNEEAFFIENTQNFFNNVERILKFNDTSISINRYKEFFQSAKNIVERTCLYSKPDVFFLEACSELFLNAKIAIKKTETQIPTKEFQAFCKIAYPSLLKQYHRWIDFIKKNEISGFQKINLLKVFGISGKEEAHSKFLVWLMKEEESHGLGNTFLKSFLNAVTDKYKRPISISLEEIIVIPEAAGDRGIPDIKIIGKDFLCIIENKIRAMEGKDQTDRYAKDAMEEIEKIKISKEHLFLIFLSPTGRLPKDKNFKPMDYNEIIKLLKELVMSHENISASTRYLIEQFIFNLEMEILHRFDLEKRIDKCLEQYSKFGDQYLWENHENIFSIYDDLLNREG